MSIHTRRLVSLVPALLLFAPALSAAQRWQSDEGTEVRDPQRARFEPRPDARQTFAALDAVDWETWESLAALLADVHARTGVPAIAAAYVEEGRIVAHATAGVRAFGSEEPAEPDDAFHLGSVTKSFTGTLVGSLVEDGKLAWDTEVGAVLGDMEMNDAYRHVTLEQLLRHRGGLPAYTDERPAGHDPSAVYTGTPVEKRTAFLADVLLQPPAGTPGETMLYSNAGYVVAGRMAERVTGKGWEELIETRVFGPLGMTTAGFGVPERPRGHAGNGPRFEPVPRSAYPDTELVAPAGNIHCSVTDLARYALAHLAGLSGKDGILRAETIQRLHTPPSLAADSPYASGWWIGESAYGPVHSHGGTVGASFASISLYPAAGSGALVLTNVGPGVGEAVAAQVTRAMLARFRPRVSGFVSAGPSGGTTGSGLEVTRGESTPAEDARVWRVFRKLAEAINDEDRKAYRALFAASYSAENRESMFDFMARNVLPVRGGIRAFHDLGPPLLLPGEELPHRTVTFHLENGFPGYFGVSLNEAGEIAEFSLFVKGDLCPNGTDRQCSKVVKVLGEEFK